MTVRRPAHYRRLMAKLRAAQTPVVQLWGWPGTGKRRFLAALSQERTSHVLVVGMLRESSRLEVEIAQATEAGVVWFLCDGGDPDGWLGAAERLLPHQSLVVASSSYSVSRELRSAAVGPRELLLDSEEVRTLWQETAGTEPEAELFAALCLTTEGWYRPVVIAAELSPEERADLVTDRPLPSALRSFLRHEVLDGLRAGEERFLVEVARVEAGATDPVTPDLLPVAAFADSVESLLHVRGLVLEEGGGWRLPRLLGRYLVERDTSRAKGRVRPTARTSQPRGRSKTETPERADYEVCLLGNPKLGRRGDGGLYEEVRWPLKRVLRLLGYLASSPEMSADRDELIDAIWPDADDDTIRKNFHPTISLLRRTLEGKDRTGTPTVLLTNGVYRLNPAVRWWFDSLEFCEQVEVGRRLAQESGDLGAWESAWRHYGGAFLHGHDAPWITRRRDRLQRLYLELLKGLGDAYLKAGRAIDAEDAYRSLLAEDPVQEAVYLAIMRIHAGRGRRDLVRRQYERLCNLLMDELGVAPMAATAEEYHRLMGGVER